MVQTTVPVLLDKEQNDCFKAQTEAQSSTDKQKKKIKSTMRTSAKEEFKSFQTSQNSC